MGLMETYRCSRHLVGGAGCTRVDNEQVEGAGFGRTAGRCCDFGRRDHNHVGGRDRRRPGALTLCDLHSRTSDEVGAGDRDRSPPIHRSRRRTHRRNRGIGVVIGVVVTGVAETGSPRVNDEQVPGTRFGPAASRGRDFVEETTTTLDAGIAVGPAPLPCPISTVAPATKPVPVILISVPPLTVPDAGLTEETVGLVETAARA